MNDRIGFLIGQDFARYGRHLPEDAPESIVSGINAYRSTRRKPDETNRFIRKWLQLRLNAFVRGKLFSEEITPDKLQYIDVPNCPISGVKLTYGTGKDTDWSIDRVINDYDYMPINIAVMSTRVNYAKGNKSPTEIRNIAATATNVVDGLTPDEWTILAKFVRQFEWATISSEDEEKLTLLEKLSYCLLTGEKPTPGISYTPPTVIQELLVECLQMDLNPSRDFDKILNSKKISKKRFHRLWKRLAKRRKQYPLNEQHKQWGNDVTINLYVLWLLTVSISEIRKYIINSGYRSAEPNTIQDYQADQIKYSI